MVTKILIALTLVATTLAVDINENAIKWESKGPTKYEVSGYVSCTCPKDTKEFTVEVDGHRIRSRFKNTQSLIPIDFVGYIGITDFTTTFWSLQRIATEIPEVLKEVRYDSEFGYPKLIVLDFGDSGGQVRIVVTDFVPFNT
jgi:hypothetical protein